MDNPYEDTTSKKSWSLANRKTKTDSSGKTRRVAQAKAKGPGKGNYFDPNAIRTIYDRVGETNDSLRSREYLTHTEIESLMKAAKQNLNRARDEAIVLIGFSHGLRASEIVNLKWSMIDLKTGLLHVKRIKNGIPSTHPLRGPELRLLNRIRREQELSQIQTGGFVFIATGGGPMTTSNLRKLVTKLGKLANLPFPVHPHMLRHSCGYHLANSGQDTRAIQHYLGHNNIQHTVKYTALSPERFNTFWKD